MSREITVAVEVGFEPTEDLRLHTLSRRAPSATRRLHRGRAYPTRAGADRRAGDARSAAVSAALREELPEQRPAVFRQDSAHHLGAMIEPAVTQDVPERARRARLRVGRPVDDPPDAGRYHRPGTHRAGLER